MMTSWRPLLACLALVFPLVGHSAEVEPAKAVIQRGIRAQGGKEKLAKLLTFTGRARGFAFENGDKLPLTLDYWYQHPGQLKYILRVTLNGNQTRTATRVFNGQQAWEKLDGRTCSLEGKQLGEMRNLANERHLLVLYPLLENSDYQLALLPEGKVGKQAVVGVKVKRKGYRDVSLYFDKTTGLLVKLSREVVNREGKTFLMEAIMSDYKEWHGVKCSSKTLTLVNGEKLAERHAVEMHFPKTLDAAVFRKP